MVKTRTVLRALPSAILFLGGAVGFWSCRETHFCECGHLSHNPVTRDQILLDTSWAVAWGAATLLILFTFRARLRWVALVLPVLVAYRLLLEQQVVMEQWLPWLPFPV